MDLTLISGPTAPTSALTEGPGPVPGGGAATLWAIVLGIAHQLHARSAWVEMKKGAARVATLDEAKAVQ